MSLRLMLCQSANIITSDVTSLGNITYIIIKGHEINNFFQKYLKWKKYIERKNKIS